MRCTKKQPGETDGRTDVRISLDRVNSIEYAGRGLRWSFLLALSFMVGCDSDETIVDPAGPSLVEVQESVFDASCAFTGCHAGDDPAGELSLERGVAYQNTVDVPSAQVPSLLRVEPGNADDSYLFIKITGDDRIAENTFRMPIGGELTDDQIQLVEDWVDAGAAR